MGEIVPESTEGVSVAEAWMKEFSIFGIPRINHNEHASNLSSDMLQQL